MFNKRLMYTQTYCLMRFLTEKSVPAGEKKMKYCVQYKATA